MGDRPQRKKHPAQSKMPRSARGHRPARYQFASSTCLGPPWLSWAIGNNKEAYNCGNAHKLWILLLPLSCLSLFGTNEYNPLCCR
uniref:Uncharacterized protein n=1 Tax=Aegilops tauschii subsp. strangulata TaxID=200361 RepID=A0A453DKN9_AEGTS